MDNDSANNEKIYLYTHSPEAEKAIEDGNASVSAGGPRRRDGTMLEMAKPLSFTLDELKAMIRDDNQLIETNDRINQLSVSLGISQESVQALSELGWKNNIAINQTYSMTYAGFQQTLAGLMALSQNISDLGQRLQQRDLDEMKEKMERYLAYMKSDGNKLGLPSFNITNSNVDEHLNDIAAFMKRVYEGLMNKTMDGFLAYSIISALIIPFTYLVRKYSVLFFYENGISAGSTDAWVDLIRKVSNDERFHEMTLYYIRLKTEIPYADKLRLAKECRKTIIALPNHIAFDLEFALYHTKDEYLNLRATVRKRIENESELIANNVIYL